MSANGDRDFKRAPNPGRDVSKGGVIWPQYHLRVGTGVQTESSTPLRSPPPASTPPCVPRCPDQEAFRAALRKIPVMISEIIYLPEMANHSNMSGSRLVSKVRHLLSLHLNLDT